MHGDTGGVPHQATGDLQEKIQQIFMGDDARQLAAFRHHRQATDLFLAAQARGLAVVEGLPMLLHQGRLGFEHWFGVDPAVTPEVYDALVARIAETQG